MCESSNFEFASVESFMAKVRLVLRIITTTFIIRRKNIACVEGRLCN